MGKSRALEVAAALGVFWVIGFVWFWIGLWTLPPDAYDSARQWWTEWALARVAQAVAIGAVAALIAALVVHRVGRSSS